MPSYLRPDAPSAAEPEELVPLVPLLPIDVPSARPAPPRLRRPLPGQEVVAGYMRTSHVVPAACPRFLPAESALRPTMCDVVPAVLYASLAALAAARHAFDLQKRRAPQHLLSYEQQWNCVDRYVHPRALSSGTSRGITLLLIHSGGFSRQVRQICRCSGF